MAAIEAEIKRKGNTNAVKQDIAGNTMSELITSIKAVKETLNDMLTVIVQEQAGSGVERRKAGKDDTGNDESSDDPEEEDDRDNKRLKV